MNPPASLPSSVSIVLELLTYYNLETDRYPTASKPKVLNQWLQNYSDHWVKLALIESLYQGRYKMVCVEQLLALWGRRGQPTYHFNSEFEALVCHNVPYQMEQAVSLPDLDSIQPQPEKSQPAMSAVSSPIYPSVLTSHSKDESRPSEGSAVLPSSGSDQNGLSEPDDIELFNEIFPSAAANPATAVFGAYHLMPVTLGRLGCEPIQRFTPAAEPDEFCRRLDAIARPPAMMTAQ
jgi:hypothetical protein